MALNPHQKNKVDISSLSEEEQKLFRLYGKLPNKKDLFQKKLSERRYFDSGDYALSKAGKSDAGVLGGGLGREHPSPESIPHLSQTQSASSNNNPNNGPGPGANAHNGEQRNSISGASPSLQPSISAGPSGSPVKESLLQRGMSVDDEDNNSANEDAPKFAPAATDPTVVAPSEEKGMPIRQ